MNNPKENKKLMYMLYVKYTDGTTENIYGHDESKLWDLIDEVRADSEGKVKQFDISEVNNV